METQTTLPVGVVAQTAGGPDRKEVTVLDVSSLPTMEDLERQYLTLVLAQTGGNKVQTAKILGFSVKTIYNKLATYSVEVIRNSP